MSIADVKCEVCGSLEGVKLSTGLVVCRECFWGNKLTSGFLNKRFAGNTNGGRR